MPLFVDDVVEAALGPWGLAVGAGIGVALLARKRLAPAANEALVGGVEATDRARDWASGLGVDRVGAFVGSLAITDRARTAAAEVGEWWSDLYAEARSEYEASRSDPSGAAAPARQRSRTRAPRAALESTEPSARSMSASRRQRDPGGRFVKRSEAAPA